MNAMKVKDLGNVIKFDEDIAEINVFTRDENGFCHLLCSFYKYENLVTVFGDKDITEPVEFGADGSDDEPLVKAYITIGI